jgi:hypothetical protein
LYQVDAANLPDFLYYAKLHFLQRKRKIMRKSFIIATENPYQLPRDMPQVEVQITPETPERAPTPEEQQWIKIGWKPEVYDRSRVPVDTPTIYH